ncbi:hypothetical protein A8W25_30690 [Streptomyces sp. ERV7]|uniref:hypothetical protein n=1 Tax=Streptomyces sp. ERV7 TaxID=1322334 RepID=UPI0007F3CF58|nr:hypothetical protein [Streptomyces sp. ERV7]OAR21897.1 hypothetical protein A8W25_30690 [Streptomyces sp. ERV7]
MDLTVMSQNVQYGAADTGRWEGLVDCIRTVKPQLLLLQEVDFLADPEQAANAEKALGLRLAVAPSRHLPTAIAWDPEYLEVIGTETKYSTTGLHHGYCALQLQPLSLPAAWPVPLVAISAHLTPYSAEAAGQEAQLLCARAYRHGGIGLIGGDINHLPLGDPEPDWDRVPPYNRASRCLRRQHHDEPWRGNRIVGQVLRDAGFTDAAAIQAVLHRDPSLLEPTGKAGRVRVDQAHLTPALLPALDSYRRIDTGEHSDHYGIALTLQLSRVDTALASAYA